VVGRYYAMDRDKRWDRVKTAVDGLVHGRGETAEGGDYVKAIEARYEENETDEFLKPIIVNGDPGRIKGVCFHSYYLQSLMVRQMAIPFSYSTIAQIACGRSAPYSVNWINPWRLTYQKTL